MSPKPRDLVAERAAEEERVSRIIRRLDERHLLALARKMAREHHVMLPEMLSREKFKASVRARHAFMKAMNEEGISWQKIAEIFETRYHSSIVHAGHSEARRELRAMEEAVGTRIAEHLRSFGMEAAARLVEKGDWHP